MSWVGRIEERIGIAAPPHRVFAWLDDPQHTGLHMNRPSLAMGGGRLRVERLSTDATGEGATYRSWGHVFGLRIDFTTTVVCWVRDREKVWRTTGEPRLVVIRHFEMGFATAALDSGTDLTLALAYDLPTRGVGRLLGRLLARPYARWCVRRIVRDSQVALGGAPSGTATHDPNGDRSGRGWRWTR